VALVKGGEAKHASEIVDYWPGGEVWIDHTNEAFAAMGSGTYAWQMVWSFFCCYEKNKPNSESLFRSLCDWKRGKIPFGTTGEKIALPEQTTNGEGFRLGGCWIVRRKIGAGALAASGNSEGDVQRDYNLVVHHQATDFVDDVPGIPAVLEVLGLEAAAAVVESPREASISSSSSPPPLQVLEPVAERGDEEMGRAAAASASGSASSDELPPEPEPEPEPPASSMQLPGTATAEP
jgi:hypothetical protein